MKNANTKLRASSVSKSRGRLLKSWAAVSVLAASLLFIGLLTGCPHNQPSAVDQPPAKPVDPIFKTDGNGKITGYKCAQEALPANLVIPAKIGDEEIKEIDRFAFSGCTGLISLTIDSANTKYKTEGNILYSKDGTTLILAAGGLTSVNIPGTVTTIDGGAFFGCTGLTSVHLPARITRIYGSAFEGCTGLTSITLPANLTKIECGAFSGCTGLISAVFVDTNGWKVYDNYSYSGTSTTIEPSDLAETSKAAKYLCEKTDKGGYCDKYWKKR